MCTWQAHGRHMAGTWQAHGKHMAGIWQARDRRMAGTWQAHGSAAVHQKQVCMLMDEGTDGGWRCRLPTLISTCLHGNTISASCEHKTSEVRGGEGRGGEGR